MEISRLQEVFTEKVLQQVRAGLGDEPGQPVGPGARSWPGQGPGGRSCVTHVLPAGKGLNSL